MYHLITGGIGGRHFTVTPAVQSKLQAQRHDVVSNVVRTAISRR